jgi:predicted HTH transcriptional regulator
MGKKTDTFKEDLAKFLEKPCRESLRDVLKSHYGELDELEFKETWPETSKLAKHILALANSGGGSLIIGVAENTDKSLDARGTTILSDKSDIYKQLHKFLPSSLIDSVSIMDFSYEASEYPRLKGKNFQVLIVSDNPEFIPFLSLAETTGLRSTVVYVRRGTSTDESTYEELQKILNRRIETGQSTRPVLDLNHHLQELRALYKNLSIYQMENPSVFIREKYMGEGYGAFVTRMIELKKRQIDNLLLSQG